MAASCRGLCDRIQSKSFGNNHKYENGYKRCSFCNIFMKFNGLRCPCCTLKLRTKSRVNSKRRRSQNIELESMGKEIEENLITVIENSK